MPVRHFNGAVAAQNNFSRKRKAWAPKQCERSASAGDPFTDCFLKNIESNEVCDCRAADSTSPTMHHISPKSCM